MPQTKQLFIEYHRRACQMVAPGMPRPRATPRMRRDGEQAWQTMTADERQTFATWAARQPGAFRARTLARPDADAAMAAAQVARNAIPPDWDNLVSTAEDAAGAMRTFIDIHQNVWDAARAMEDFVFALPLPGPPGFYVVRDLAASEFNRADAELFATQADITRLQNDADNPPVPARPNGTFKMLKSSLSMARRRRRNDFIRQAFVTQTSAAVNQPGRNWVGSWRVGSVGGFGRTGLLISVDNQQNVNFRTMKKEVRLDKERWKSIDFFDGDVRHKTRRMPLEISCHRQMQTPAVASGSSGERLVPAVMSSSVNDTDYLYTMFLGYCPMGDLRTLIRRHRAAAAPIQEPFIWYVFKTLAEAGLAMESGGQALAAPAPGVRPGWGVDRFNRDNWQIVHRDLKPANVFLAETVPDRGWPDYPRPKLGDFGLAIKTWAPNPGDPNNVDGLNPDIFVDGAGTPGFRAPEMRAYIDRGTALPVDSWPLSSKTNVWGVGMVIYCLVTLVTAPRQSDWLGNPALDVPSSLANQAAVYNAQLHFLIGQCLHHDPARRWTFRQIIRAINTNIQENALDLAQGMRAPSVRPYTAARTGNLLNHLPNDLYALGLNSNQLPPQ
ncbi:hypothetical protein LTR08_005775 [Meristemomyces frigidus]|nr:hypothetical protein LTR08_005775 [Meristemomyces frigidus]